MGQISDSSGNIVTRQGDTFYIDLTDIDPELGGDVYVQVINEKRQPMFTSEPSVSILGLTEVRITISAELSDLLTVGRNEDYREYKYAVKHIKNGIEDTWFLGSNQDFADLPTITVYPKVVEGE